MGYITRFFTEDNGLVLSSGYGPRRYKKDGKWVEDFHNGKDYSGPRGLPILCPKAGVVTHTGFDKEGYGYYVGIRLPTGHTQVFAHLDSISVKKGETVTKGQEVGALGSTGYSTGPHLHYQLNVPGGGVRGANAWGDPDLFNWGDTVDKLVIYNSHDDEWASREVERAVKAPRIMRGNVSLELINQVDELYVVGGPEILAPGKVIYLSGADRYETAQAVIDYLKK